MSKFDNVIKKILITEKELHQGIQKAANWVNLNYENRVPILLGILKGCIPFFGSLLPKLTISCKTDFMAISSFKGEIKAQSEPEIILDMTENIKGEDVLIVEDIIDTARSLKKVVELLKLRGAKSVKILTLLDKKAGRAVELDADFSCFEIPNVFIVGFGLDYKEKYRNIPFIGILKEEIYS